MGNNNIQTPQKPKFRSLKTLAKNVRFMPYLIDGDIDEIDPTDDKAVADALTNDGNFFVLIAPLKYKSYLDYENSYGEGLDLVVNRILFCLSIAYGMLKDADDKPVTLQVDDLGAAQTPYGKMYGSLERNMVDLAVFIMSQHGRIVGCQENGTFLCKKITTQDIIERLDPRAMLKIEPEAGNLYTSLFMEILEVAGVWVPDEIQNQLVESGDMTEEEDDGLKNLVEPSNES